MDNTIMLITYADSLGKNLKELGGVLRDHLDGVVGAVHILPFFPSSADRGFAPMRYDMVDPAFGDFEDIRAIAQRHAVMFDFMVNHISAHSPYFEDFLKNKDASPYRDMFIRYKDFWPGGAPTEDQVDRIYKRKPRAPSITVTFADGTTEDIWCTFCEEQIDLNMNSAVARKFIRSTLRDMCEKGAAVIRLDAFAYAVKKPDTSCFFIEPEMWELLEDIEEVVKPYGVDILPEIHEHYTIQQKIADKGFWVYDFALPMLVLHALYTGKGEELVHWLNICPRRQFTTLDTHDGIGVVDVADLMSQEEIDATKEALFTKGANVKKIYNTAAYNNLDIYQINCTYYSALGDQDAALSAGQGDSVFRPRYSAGVLRRAAGRRQRHRAAGKNQAGPGYQPPLLFPGGGGPGSPPPGGAEAVWNLCGCATPIPPSPWRENAGRRCWMKLPCGLPGATGKTN